MFQVFLPIEILYSCLNLGGTLARCGLVGSNNYDIPLNAIGNKMPINIQATYNRGQHIDLETVLTAHHMGMLPFINFCIEKDIYPMQPQVILLSRHVPFKKEI